MKLYEIYKGLNETNDNVVYHGTEGEITNFNLDNVNGGARARYGWGLYFTKFKHKSERDYGNKNSGHLYSTDISNLNLLDVHHNHGERVTQEFIKMGEHKLNGIKNIIDELESLNSETINYVMNKIPYQEMAKDPEILLNKLHSMISSVKNIRDYDMLDNAVKSAEPIIEKHKPKYSIDNVFLNKLSNYIGELFSEANLSILSSIEGNKEKDLSLFYKKLGYDGFIHGDEVVLFNLDNVKIDKVYQ